MKRNLYLNIALMFLALIMPFLFIFRQVYGFISLTVFIALYLIVYSIELRQNK